MNDQAETPVLPIEQRIADVVVRDSICKMVDEDNLDAGHCSVELLLHNYIPEYTPSDFSPSNDVEQFMSDNKVATSLVLTLPFSFKLPFMIKGIAANIVNIEHLYDVDVQTYLRAEEGIIQVELINRELRRSLYLKITSHPN